MSENGRLRYNTVDGSRRACLQSPEPAVVRHLNKTTKNDLSDGFRLAMRELAAGVCLVTTAQGSDRAGLTATSVSSLSVAPPSLLVSIQCTSRALKALQAFGRFGVTMLAGNQREIANRFSGRRGVHGAARFDGDDWRTGASGVPLLPSALAAVECTVERVMDWHTHCIVVGTVSNVLVRGGGDALVYWRGRYCVPADRSPPTEF